MNIRLKLTVLLAGLAVVVIVASGAFFLYSLRYYFTAHAADELRTKANQIDLFFEHLSNDSSSHEAARAFVLQSGVACTVYDLSGHELFNFSESPGRTRASDVSGAEDLVYEFQRGVPETINSGTAKSRSGLFASAARIRVEMSIIPLNSAISEIRTKTFIAGIFAILLVIALTGLIAARLTAPITEMAEIARQIRSGALDRRLPVRGGDEFAQLASTLNAMVDRMNEDIGKLQKLEEIRSQFLGNVSHELRTPLFALQGMLETLLAGAVDDKEVSHDFVGRALANTMRLDALLRDLIEISRIESGEMKMSFRYFPLNGFLEEIIDELAPLAEQKNLALQFLPDAGEVEVYGDRLWLKQAIVNILENALKYTPSGSVTLSTSSGESLSAAQPNVLAVGGSVRTETGGQQGVHSQQSVVVTITDTGIGIPAEHLSRIFERFYRVDRERSRDAGGTGLGLAIVKHIIEAHGSSVDVLSSPGAGSTFSFRLSR